MQRKRATSRAEVEPASNISCTREQLFKPIEEQLGPLLGIVCAYTQTMGLARGDEVKPVAEEVVQETIVEALSHPERYDPDRRLLPWLLGIALNIIRRRRAEVQKYQRRELSLTLLSRHQEEPLSESDILDRLMPVLDAGPEQIFEDAEQARHLLALASTEDQQVLRLALLADVESSVLGRKLGLTPGAARVRLHRALSRLRSAWLAQQNYTNGG